MTSIPPDKLQIGRALLSAGPLTQELLQRELDAAGKSQSVLGKALLQSGFPTEEEMILPLLQRLRIPKINARKTTIPLETVRLIPEEVARRTKVLALDQIGTILVVVTPDVSQEAALAEVRKITGMVITPIQCAVEGFDEILTEYYTRLNDSGLAAPAPTPTTAAPTEQPVASGDGHGSNGVVKAIPVGADTEDSFFKRFMSAGPVPADEQAM
jgi:type IV pilus assembly protein PilB